MQSKLQEIVDLASEQGAEEAETMVKDLLKDHPNLSWNKVFLCLPSIVATRSDQAVTIDGLVGVVEILVTALPDAAANNDDAEEGKVGQSIALEESSQSIVSSSDEEEYVDQSIAPSDDEEEYNQIIASYSSASSDEEEEEKPKRKREDDDAAIVPLSAETRKQIRALKPLKSKLTNSKDKTSLDTLFALERDDSATVEHIRPILHVLSESAKEWPQKYQDIFLGIENKN